MRRTLSIAFLILGLAGAAFAQAESDEFNPLPTTNVETSVNLRLRLGDPPDHQILRLHKSNE